MLTAHLSTTHPPTHPPGRFGPCEPADLKQRMKSAIATLGEEEVHDILRTEGKLEASV